MKVDLPPGKYVVAVSGGVDSMVLLDLLAQRTAADGGLQLTIAHYEHGIRDDSDLDRQLVERAAAHYGLPFIFEHGHLGARTGEATARRARYDFLRRTKREVDADAIITAHHQDDLIETAVINILRGTGRKGLSSLGSNTEVIRPLLAVSKQAIYDYARRHPDITWHEDSTNRSDDYLRNYVRHHIVQKLNEASRAQLLNYLKRAAAANPTIDRILLGSINEHVTGGQLDRRWFVMLPYDVSCEVMAAWLRGRGIREFDRRLIARLVVAAKVLVPGKREDINAGYLLEIGKYGIEIRFRSLSR